MNREAATRTPSSVPHIVIVGAGFAGLQAAKRLRRLSKRGEVRVTVLDRSNHHLFQPLLYQVATAGLSPADIAVPTRHVLRRHPHTEVLMGEVADVNLENRSLVLSEGRKIRYDFLVVATGATHSYFGKSEWEKHAPGLKSLADATRIRESILCAFERAEMIADEKEHQALLTFVIVGGGPTGVELAGSLSELSHAALAKDFRHVNPRSARIILIEAGPRILATFPEKLSRRAQESLEKLDVEVWTHQRVEKVDEDGVEVRGAPELPPIRVDSRTVIWAAGVIASPAARWLKADHDRAGRVIVGPDLTLPGHPEIFVIGDTAHVVDDEGTLVPGVAPAAMQQGRYVAQVIKQRLRVNHMNADVVDAKSAVQTPIPVKPFHYTNKGNLATIGRSSAIADLGWVWLSGWIAWMSWLVVHITYLIGFRNRFLVLFQWAWSYFTFKRGARLITGVPLVKEGSVTQPESRSEEPKLQRSL